MPYTQPLPTGTYDYYSQFTPNKERQLILFQEDVKGVKTLRLIASNGTGYLVDLQEQISSAFGNNVTLKADKVVEVVIPKDDPIQNLEGQYRALMSKFISSGYSDFTPYSNAQSLKVFALSQGYSYQTISAWDIGLGGGK